MCARKGFDAVELDDIDSFDPPSTTGFQLTLGDAQNYLAWAFNEVHRYGMTVLWKNSPYLSWWGVPVHGRGGGRGVLRLRDVFRGATARQQPGRDHLLWPARRDAVRLGRASPRTGTARQPTGKWVGEAEYGGRPLRVQPWPDRRSAPGGGPLPPSARRSTSRPTGSAAVKFDVDLDGKMFFPCPHGT